MPTSSATSNRLPNSRDLTPSPFVRECAEKVLRASMGMPILDVACGSGRNGLYLASLGCEVIFVDRDLTQFHDRGRFPSFQIDLAQDQWPFASRTLGGIIDVHFLLPSLFPRFAASLAPGGYLLLETVPGCGRNYLELPKLGRLRQELTEHFDFEKYRERKIKPPNIDAVMVRLLARRRS
jgi:SAM-dependent methyltransferase